MTIMNLYVHNNATLNFVKNFKDKKANPFQVRDFNMPFSAVDRSMT